MRGMKQKGRRPTPWWSAARRAISSACMAKRATRRKVARMRREILVFRQLPLHRLNLELVVLGASEMLATGAISTSRPSIMYQLTRTWITLRTQVLGTHMATPVKQKEDDREDDEHPGNEGKEDGVIET